MKSRTFGTYLIIALSAAVTLLLVSSKSFCIEAAYPFGRLRQLWATHVGSRLSGVFDGAAAAAENVRLRREAAAATALRGELERVQAENANFRRLLAFRAAARGEWIAGGILSRGGAAGVREMIRIDCGSLKGVKPGAVVMAPEGLVGRVSAVTPHTADVMLITDARLKVSCEIDAASGDRLLATLCGGSEEELVLRFFSGRVKPAAGGRVVTSGMGGVFPRGIEVGALVSVEEETQTSGLRGRVRPSVSFQDLENVFIRCEK